MIHQLLTLLFILCLFLWNKRVKRGVINVSGFIVLIYLISIALSFPYVKEFNLEKVVYKTYFIWYGLWFCLLLLLFLFPLLKFDEAKKKCIVLPPQNILESFAIVVGVLSLLSIIYFVPIVVNVFSLYDMSVARVMATGDGGNPFIKEGLLNTIASVSSSFFGICVFLGYIFYIQHKVKLAGFMLLSSLAYVFNVFAYVGRDGVIFWGISMMLGFVIFRNYMTVVQKKIIMSSFILVLCCFAFLFIRITSDRFSDQSFVVSIIDYYGQSYPNFCLFMDVDYPISWGAGFPLFRELLGMGEVSSVRWEMGDTVSWVFGTFIKSLHGNFGPGWTLVIALISALMISGLLKPRSVNLKFNTLFILIMYFNIISQGVFYFRYATRASNLYILMSFVLYLLFSFFCRKSENVLVKSVG